MAIDTAEYPRPLARNIWDFIRTHSDEYIIMMDDAMRRLRPGANPDVNFTASPSEELRAEAQRIVERYIAQSANLPSVNRHPFGSMYPLRRGIDYQATARAVFLVDELPPGAVPVYNIDPIETPPPTIPFWVTAGAWIENYETQAIGRVIHVDADHIEINLWRSELRRVIDRRSFHREPWGLTKEPNPKTWYERLDDE